MEWTRLCGSVTSNDQKRQWPMQGQQQQQQQEQKHRQLSLILFIFCIPCKGSSPTKRVDSEEWKLSWIQLEFKWWFIVGGFSFVAPGKIISKSPVRRLYFNINLLWIYLIFAVDISSPNAANLSQLVALGGSFWVRQKTRHRSTLMWQPMYSTAAW